MIDLIKADLRRIIGKKSFRRVLETVAVIALLMVFAEKKNDFNGLLYAMNRYNALTNFIALFVGIASFIGIYADEFSAKTLQSVIGRGIPRYKVIAVKLIDCTVLVSCVFFVFWVFFLVLGLLLGAKMNAEEYKMLALAAVCGAYIVICATPIAAAVIFATDNAALSVFIEILIISAVPLVFSLLDNVLFVHNSHIAAYSINGFANEFFSSMVLYGGGVGKFILGAVIYLGLSYIFTVLIAGKKELEF
ncbi:MAG: hypothetical protein IJ736_14545 [Firmicutes bacterium]|nr:hypothetical protein [Bacillota bacterium]